MRVRCKTTGEVFEINEKYFLSEKTINGINNHDRKVPYLNGQENNSNAIIAGYYKIPRDGQYIKIQSATSKGYELAEIGEDSINFEHPFKIRKLTPRECFRLMDFPESFDFSCVSDSQAYKQAGNSIVVNVLSEIIKKLKL